MHTPVLKLSLASLVILNACGDFAPEGSPQAWRYEDEGAPEIGKASLALVSAKTDCDDRYVPFDGGVDVFRECGPDRRQRCYVEGTWSDERAAYSFGRQKCYSHLPSPQPVECYDVPDRCDGNRAQTCSDHGRWETRETCRYRCEGAGVCGAGRPQPLDLSDPVVAAAMHGVPDRPAGGSCESQTSASCSAATGTTSGSRCGERIRTRRCTLISMGSPGGTRCTTVDTDPGKGDRDTGLIRPCG